MIRFIPLQADPPQAHRKAVSLRISVTDRCQLRCSFCMPPKGVEKIGRDQILSFERILAFVRVVKARFGLAKVHLTGGEPLLRNGITELISMLAEENVTDLALTTNGLRLSEMTEDLKKAGLHRVNISLVSLNKDTFRQLTGGGELKRTMTGIQSALNSGLRPVKLNMIVLKNSNDHEVANMARFGIETGCEVRFLELMPIGPAAEYFNKLFVSSEDVKERLKPVFDLQTLSSPMRNSSLRFKIVDTEGRQGTIGFISSCTAPFCHSCNRLRLMADGRLIGCLALGQGPDIKPWIQHEKTDNEQALVDLVDRTLRLKRDGRRFTTTSAMISVGG